jgi:hypothetical protein
MVQFIEKWCKSFVEKCLTPKSIGKSAKDVKTGWIKVYSEQPLKGLWNGKTNLAWTTGRSGVYIIREGLKTVVYVGKSTTNLYRTIMRHFQEWNDRRQPERISYQDDLTEKVYYVQIILCKPNDIPLYEGALIAHFRTRDNKEEEAISEKQMHTMVEKYRMMKTIDDADFVPF